MSDQAFERKNMVESQVRPNRVTDVRLIHALDSVERERFLPPARQGVAYLDADMEVSPGRFDLQPMVLARLLQAAEIAADDIVLVVGCATGYTAAVLSRLARAVVGLECDPAMAAHASELLTDIQADNAVVVTGDLPGGHGDQGPYNVILVNGAVDTVPRVLTGQLADAGRLVAIVSGARPARAILFSMLDGLISQRVLFEASARSLPGFAADRGFEFKA